MVVIRSCVPQTFSISVDQLTSSKTLICGYLFVIRPLSDIRGDWVLAGSLNVECTSIETTKISFGVSEIFVSEFWIQRSLCIERWRAKIKFRMLFVDESVLEELIWFSIKQNIIWVSTVWLSIIGVITWRSTWSCSIISTVALIATASTSFNVNINQAPTAWKVFGCQYVFNLSQILLILTDDIQNLCETFPLPLLL